MEADRLTLIGRSLKIIREDYTVLFVPRVQLSFIGVDHETNRHMAKEEMERQRPDIKLKIDPTADINK